MHVTEVSTILKLPSMVISPYEPSILVSDNVMWRLPVLLSKMRSAPVTFFHILRQFHKFILMG